MSTTSPTKKSPSVSSDQYDSLKADPSYVNEKDKQEYLNPLPEKTNVRTNGHPNTKQLLSNPGPVPPPRAFDRTPAPPTRDLSISSGTGSDDAFRMSPTSPGSDKGNNFGNNIGKAGSKTKVFRKETGHAAPPTNEKVLLRQKNSAFDSGVGDLEHIHIDGSQPKTYDYADYGHQYEELPNRKSIVKCDSGLDSRSELYQSSGGATDVGSEADDTANIVHNHQEKRKRMNPLYDGMTQSMPSIYSKSKDVKDEALRRQVRCLKCALVVLVVISCASLAISLYAFVNYNQTKDDADPVLTPKVEKLSDSYTRLEQLLSSFDDNNDTMKVLSDLIRKVNMIEGNLTAKVNDLQQQLYTQENNIYNNNQEILETHDNISSIISSLNLTLQLQLYNISKQEGPMGPQGVANFSRCSYYNVSNDAPATQFPNLSPWAPTETDLETNIAIFATCTVEGGTNARMEVRPLSTSRIQYRCECSGTVSGEARRLCYVHILSCPRESVSWTS